MDKTSAACLAFIFGLAGCSVVKPADTMEENSISVSDAMQDIGLGFYKLNAEVSQNPNLKLGLYACEVSVNFNIASTRTKDGKLAIGATIPLKVARVNGSYDADSGFSIDRGNTVSVTMESAACLDRDILVAEAGGTKNSSIAPTTPGTTSKTHSLTPTRAPHTNPTANQGSSTSSSTSPTTTPGKQSSAAPVVHGSTTSPSLTGLFPPGGTVAFAPHSLGTAAPAIGSPGQTVAGTPLLPTGTLPGSPNKLFFPLPPGYAASIVKPFSMQLPDGKIITLTPQTQ